MGAYSGQRLLLLGLERGWPWLLAGGAAVALLVLLYRSERQLVPRRTGLLLLCLRLAAAAALLVALLDPVVQRTRRETLRGRVILGVDVSASMEATDPARSSPAQTALRQQLGLSSGADVARLTRREVTRGLLAGGWGGRLERAHTVEALAFARDPAPATRSTLADQLQKPANLGDPAALVTDWEGVLEQGLNAGGDQAPVTAVVLLTDGRGNGPPAARPAAGRLAAASVPVYPVLVGQEQTPRDAAIAAIRAPEAVDVGTSARIDVTIKADGAPEGTELTVRLERPGAEAMVQTIRAQPDGGRPVVTFRVPLESVGTSTLKVGVEGLPDAFPQNDQRQVRVAVVDTKADVLLVDDHPRWEFQYLRNALARDPRVTLQVVQLRQPELPGTSERLQPTELPALEPPNGPDSPPPPDPLGRFDLIVLGDLDPGSLPGPAWDRLDRYVAERGGTLVIAAGARNWPEPVSGSATIQALLPVQDVRLADLMAAPADAAPTPLPFGPAILPTAEAAAGSWPMLQLAEESGASLDIWRSLPGQPWAVVGRPKPTATALARLGESETPTGAESSVMAAMPYGLGKVFWIGTDGTWRWRSRVGDAYHHRFWSQVVQWAVQGKLAAGNRLVQFGADPPRIPEGEAPLLRARFQEAAGALGSDTLMAVRILAPSGDPGGEPRTVAVVPLRPRPDQPRAFEASAPRLPPGAYRARLEVPDLADAMSEAGGAPEAELEVTPRETLELVELGASRDALDRLASTTGGFVARDHEADRVLTQLARRQVVRTRVEPLRLADRPEALVLFFGLLTAEWVLRKRAGLP